MKQQEEGYAVSFEEAAAAATDLLAPRETERSVAASLNYEYEPLSTPTSIRLMKLYPDRGEEDRLLRVSLTTVNLVDEPIYHALSYSWGNPHADGIDFAEHFSAVADEYKATRKVQIDCNGRRAYIQQNLYDALCELPRRRLSPSHPAADEFVWIDAICINQDDLGERADQVKIMDMVYRKAAYTVIWLGRADKYTEAAAATISRIAAYPRDVFAHSTITPFRRGESGLYEGYGLERTSWMDWCSLAALLKRQWFYRVWIVQESVLSPRLVVYCGRYRIPWDQLVAAARTIDARCAVLGHRPSTLFLQHHEVAVPLEHNVIRLADWREYQSFLDSDAPSTSSTSVSLSSNKSYTLETLIYDVWTFHATNPRDKIYGIFGLMSPAVRDLWHVDYSEPVEECFAFATRRIIRQSRTLKILSCIQDASVRRIAARPSWVPDYSVPFFNVMCQNGFFSAAGEQGPGSFIPLLSSPRWDRLRVSGGVFDTIVETADDRNDYVNSMMLLEPSWFELALLLPEPYHRTGQSRTEALWRTLCADQDAADRSPAPARFSALFRELLCGMVVVRAELEAENALLQNPPKACAPSLGAALQEARRIWKDVGWEGREREELLAETSVGPRLLSHPDYGWLVYTLLKMRMLLETAAERDCCLPSWEFLEEFERNPTYVMRVIVGEEKHLQQPKDPAFVNSYARRYGKRRLFVTQKGFLGLGPASAQVGDVVSLFRGAAGPFVCRRHQGGNGDVETLQVVGEGYTHGIMYGEAVGMEGFTIKEVELL